MKVVKRTTYEDMNWVLIEKIDEGEESSFVWANLDSLESQTLELLMKYIPQNAVIEETEDQKVIDELKSKSRELMAERRELLSELKTIKSAWKKEGGLLK